MKAPTQSLGNPAADAAAPPIVGRNVELEAMAHFLDRLGCGPAALVLEGQPGIGKTTVWRQLFARSAGHVVLSCRPVEAETKLAFAALADLLEPVADAILPALPEPQRLALDVALMHTSPGGVPPSARAVATAVLSALRLLTVSSPVVLAIDDQQWLDRASAEALAFALRRIGDHRVGVVAAVRVEDGTRPDPLALDRTFAGRLERLALGPLSIGALHQVIRTHLDHVFPRPTLRRIADVSAGNPFFALELARALIDGAPQGPREALPVPDTLASFVARRLDRLPARARDVLLVVAALSAPTVTLVRRAVGPADADAAIARATHARAVDVRGDAIRFTHPLLASAVYSLASPDARRDVHRRLARLIAGPEERARHLALAASAPDEDVARALDEASVLARRRGAPDTAGELQEWAARLTRRDDAAASRRRRAQAAEHFAYGGDRGRARALLEALLAEGIAGEERAMALRLLGQIRGQEEGFADAVANLEEALTHAQHSSSRAAVGLDLAYATYNVGDASRAVCVARDALADAERFGEPGLVADALAAVVMGEFIVGHGSDQANLARAVALEDRSRCAPVETVRPRSPG